MKKLTLLIALVVLSYGAVYAQSVSKLKTLFKSKDYLEASSFIQDAIKESPKSADVYVISGDVYYELEKIDSARIMYEKAFDLKSSNCEIMRKYGRALSLLNRHTEAFAVLKRALKEDPKDPYNLLEMGNAYIKADSMNQAELIITRAKSLNSKLGDAYLALGNLYFAQKIWALAKDNYEEAINLDKNLTDARVKLATSYYWLANQTDDEDIRNTYFNRSLEEWQSVTQLDPKNARAFYEAGRINFLAKYYEDAAKFLNRYVILNPQGSLGRWYLAQSLIELGMCDTAAQHVEIVSREIDSVKYKAKLLLARGYYGQQKLPEAIKLFNEVKTSPVMENDDIERLARAYIRSNDTTDALKIYRELVDKDPSRCQIMMQLGSLCTFMLKDYDNAIYFFKKKIEKCKDEQTGKALYYLGMTYLNMQKADTAAIYFAKTLEVEPGNLVARLYLGDAYAQQKMKDSAKVQYSAVIEAGMAKPDSSQRELSNAYSKMCSMLFEERDFKELNKLAKQWTEFDDKSVNGFIFLAISYQGTNNLEGACKAFKKVLQIDPNNSIARKSVKDLGC